MSNLLVWIVNIPAGRLYYSKALEDIMGFRYRKSIHLGGGFRINLSKSGVGYSWGIPGYRITKTAKGRTRRTYSIPGTGLSYVEESGSTKKHTQNKSPNIKNKQRGIAEEQLQNIESASIESFKAADPGNITTAIEKTIVLNQWSTVLIALTLLIPAFPILIILVIIGVVLKIISHKQGVVLLVYTLDNEKEAEYKRRTKAWQILAKVDKSWQIIQEAHVSNQKINAGASRNINRVICKVVSKLPYYIKSNVDTIQVKLHKEMLIFLPDKVFLIRKNKVGLLNYEDVSIRVSQTRFIESDSVPKDAVVIGSTWKYVNKNGTADKRYSNNRQLPICLYGVVYLTSSTGLNVEMQFSNYKSTENFEELINKYSDS